MVCNVCMSPLELAIDLAGGSSKLAAALGVSVQRLSNWLVRGVPAKHCPSIERITGGKVACEHLCPDVEWTVLRRPATPALPVESIGQLSSAPPPGGEHAAADNGRRSGCDRRTEHRRREHRVADHTPLQTERRSYQREWKRREWGES
jgi:DNA-binding transcriptional regulator YdaS (Cro superfamily)